MATFFKVIIFSLKASGLGFLLWNVLAKGRPIIAISLWIVDLIKKDRKAFDGYGFYLYCGLGGTGKTLSIVDKLIHLRRAYPKLLIYTNFDFEYADGYIDDWEDILNIENYEFIEISEKEFNKLGDRHKTTLDGKFYKRVNNGVVFGFDEIHMTLNSQGWKDAPENLLYYVSQQRKLHKMILASSQVWSRINIILREQTNFVIECRAMFMGRLIYNKTYNTETYIPPTERRKGGKMKCLKRYSFVAYDGIRNKYDTEQIMKSLIPEKTNSDLLLESFKKVLSDVTK